MTNIKEMLDKKTKQKLIESNKNYDDEQKIANIFAWFIKNVDYNYESISPIRNVPYELIGKGFSFYHEGHYVRSEAIYRKKFGLPLSTYTSDYLEREYNIIKDDYPALFNEVNQLTDNYVEDLKKMGIKDYTNKIEVNKIIEKEKKKIAKKYQTKEKKKFIGSDYQIATQFQSLCNELNINSEIVYGYIDIDEYKHNNISWNKINDREIDIAAAIRKRDKGLDYQKEFRFDENSYETSRKVEKSLEINKYLVKKK